MNWKRWILPVGVGVVALGAGYWFGNRSSGTSQGNNIPSGPPVAHVTLARVERKSIAHTVTAYGSVITQPGKNHAVSVAYETRVQHILVAPGEMVAADQPLVQIAPSPQTQLQLAQAQSAAQTAQNELQQTEQKFKLHLATNQNLNQAKQNADSAKLQLQTLQNQGAASPQTVNAQMAGLVGKVNVQDGQIVPPGSPLVELVQQNEIEVKLGVEPEDAVHVTVGQPVSLFRVHMTDAQPLVGHVRLITQRVDPSTRLVDVYVTLPNEANLWLDSYYRGEVKTEAHQTLVAPRSAVLPQGDKHILFTVRNQHAVAHQVQLGIQTTHEVEVIANDLQSNEPVVVKGNYELSDGMAVTTGQKP